RDRLRRDVDVVGRDNRGDLRADCSLRVLGGGQAVGEFHDERILSFRPKRRSGRAAVVTGALAITRAAKSRIAMVTGWFWSDRASGAPALIDADTAELAGTSASMAALNAPPASSAVRPDLGSARLSTIERLASW